MYFELVGAGKALAAYAADVLLLPVKCADVLTDERILRERLWEQLLNRY